MMILDRLTVKKIIIVRGRQDVISIEISADTQFPKLKAKGLDDPPCLEAHTERGHAEAWLESIGLHPPFGLIER